MATIELNQAGYDAGPSGDWNPHPDEQPLQLIVGTREMPRPGKLPTAAARAAMTANARYLTRVPKGVYLYDTPEQMNSDRERWTVELMVSRQQERRRIDGTKEGGDELG